MLAPLARSVGGTLFASLLLAACGGSSPAPGVGATAAPFNEQACESAWRTPGATSRWVYPDSHGLLGYRPLDTQGDRIMDFSSAGYAGGGVAFPTPAPSVTVAPIGHGADDRAAIQHAIDQVSALPPDGAGLRGVVLLAAGDFSVAGPLAITTGGVVLRGSGSGPSGTTIHDIDPAQTAVSAAAVQPGAAAPTLLSVTGGASVKVPSTTESITDTDVAAGAVTLTLADSAGFHVGSRVLVERPVTAAWVSFMGMQDLGVGAIWLAPGSTTSWQRTITSVVGGRVTLDAPVSDSMDATFTSPPGGTVSLATTGETLRQVGIEHLRFVGVPRSRLTDNRMLAIDDVVDGWIDDVVGDNFTSGVSLGAGVSRFTLRGVALTHEDNATDVPCTGAKFSEFALDGSQILLDASSSAGAAASFYVVTRSRAPGPNVVLGFQGTPDAACSIGSIQPHERWATGLLVDNAALAPNAGHNSSVGGSIDFGNRGNAGTGQGWAIGWGVVWNSIATFDIQSPPGATNWAIGSTGTVVAQTTEPAGTIDSPDVPVAPKSLYLAQLCERLGPQALVAIGH